MKTERRAILFSGQVQGVGFRYTAVQLSRDLRLGGTVRNLPDGRVEMVVEGAGSEIDEVISRLREHFGGSIRKVDQDVVPALGDVGPGIRIVH